MEKSQAELDAKAVSSPESDTASGQVFEIDRDVERRLVRKIDYHILPWICFAYLINYLDRVNLGNARTLNNDKPADNLVHQLNLKGNRYSIVVAVFCKEVEPR